MKLLYNISFTFLFVSVFLPTTCFAALGNHYIEDHSIDITLNQDSSVTVIEKMVKVDNDTEYLGVFTSFNYGCGNGCVDTSKMHPIKMLRVTDFSGKEIKYAYIKDTKKHNITYRIWDLRDITAGKRDIIETTQIKNSLNTTLTEPYYDIFYRFLYQGYEYSSKGITATIHFPASITKNNSESFVDLRDAQQKAIKDVPFEWIDDKTIRVNYQNEIPKGQILTLYSRIPKNTLDPYVPTFREKYDDIFEKLRIINWMLPSLGFLIICLIIWVFLGKDYKSKKTIIAEYTLPENLSLMEVGVLVNDCNISERCLSGEIVKLINDGYLEFNITENKMNIKRSNKKEVDLQDFEKVIMNIFSDEFEAVRTYYNSVDTDTVIKIYHSVLTVLEKKGLALNKNQRIRRYFLPGSLWFLSSIWLLYSSIQLLPLYNPDEISFFMIKFAVSNIIPTYIIGYLFFKVMPKTSRKGEQTIRAIKGYKEYLAKTDKFPEIFNQDQNRITLVSPYVTLFGTTEKWHKVFRQFFNYKDLKDLPKLENKTV